MPILSATDLYILKRLGMCSIQSPVMYYISGNISAGGIPLEGVTVTFGAFSTYTDSNGDYMFDQCVPGSSGTITPTLAGYTFTPISIAVPAMSGNVVGQDFEYTSLAYSPSLDFSDYRNSMYEMY